MRPKGSSITRGTQTERTPITYGTGGKVCLWGGFGRFSRRRFRLLDGRGGSQVEAEGDSQGRTARGASDEQSEDRTSQGHDRDLAEAGSGSLTHAGGTPFPGHST